MQGAPVGGAEPLGPPGASGASRNPAGGCLKEVVALVAAIVRRSFSPESLQQATDRLRLLNPSASSAQRREAAASLEQLEAAPACTAFNAAIRQHLFAAFSLVPPAASSASQDSAAGPPAGDKPGPPVTLRAAHWSNSGCGCFNSKVTVDATLLQRRLTRELLELMLQLLDFPALLPWLFEAFCVVGISLHILLVLHASATAKADANEGAPARTPAAVQPPSAAALRWPLGVEVVLGPHRRDCINASSNTKSNNNGTGAAVLWTFEGSASAQLPPVPRSTLEAAAGFVCTSAAIFSNAAVAAAAIAEDAPKTAATPAAVAEDWASLLLQASLQSWLSSLPLMSLLAASAADAEAYAAMKAYVSASAGGSPAASPAAVALSSLRQLAEACGIGRCSLSGFVSPPKGHWQQQQQQLQRQIQGPSALPLLFAAATAPAVPQNCCTLQLRRLQRVASQGLAAAGSMCIAALAAAANTHPRRFLQQPHQGEQAPVWLVATAAAEAQSLEISCREQSGSTSLYTADAAAASATLQRRLQECPLSSCWEAGVSSSANLRSALCSLLLQECSVAATMLEFEGRHQTHQKPHASQQQHQQQQKICLLLDACMRARLSAQLMLRLLKGSSLRCHAFFDIGGSNPVALQQHRQQQPCQTMFPWHLLSKIAASWMALTRIMESCEGAHPAKCSLGGAFPSERRPHLSPGLLSSVSWEASCCLLKHPHVAPSCADTLRVLEAFLAAAVRAAPFEELRQLRKTFLEGTLPDAAPPPSAVALPAAAEHTEEKIHRAGGLSIFLNLIITAAEGAAERDGAASGSHPLTSRQTHEQQAQWVLQVRQEQLLLQQMALRMIEETALDFPLAFHAQCCATPDAPRLHQQHQQQTPAKADIGITVLWFAAAALAGSSRNSISSLRSSEALAASVAENERQLIQRLVLWSYSNHPALASLARRCWICLASFAAEAFPLSPQQRQQQQQQPQLRAAAARLCAMLFAVATHSRPSGFDSSAANNADDGLLQLCIGETLQLVPSEQQVRLFRCFAVAAHEAVVAAARQREEQQQHQQTARRFAEQLLQLPLAYGAEVLSRLGYGEQQLPSSSRSKSSRRHHKSPVSLPLWLSMLAPMSAAVLHFPLGNGGPSATPGAAQTLEAHCRSVLEALLDVTQRTTAADATLQEPPPVLQQDAAARAAAAELLQKHQEQQRPVMARHVDLERAAVEAVCDTVATYAQLAAPAAETVLLPFVEELSQFVEHYLCSPEMAAAAPRLFACAIALSCCCCGFPLYQPNQSQEQQVAHEHKQKATAAAARLQHVVQAALPPMLLLHPMQTAEALLKCLERGWAPHLVQGIRAALQQGKADCEMLQLLHSLAQISEQQCASHNGIYALQQQLQVELSTQEQEHVAYILRRSRLLDGGSTRVPCAFLQPLSASAAVVAGPLGATDAHGAASITPSSTPGLDHAVASVVSQRLLQLLPLMPSASAAQEITGKDAWAAQKTMRVSQEAAGRERFH
ncbi:uncharacterized protein LOC34622100 [Cyclospora cayetanensis]|uniref:Uncharacterized protein LOC34622100 n=1 Tax=Cyclospora cayetanensis TaxID=88456 RepID=A0A6P6RUJ8_9EIME|nr:uncharacterized protein LOC34622100 [Cyclospora cayetanensis]